LIGHVLRDGAALNEPRHLQKLIQTHVLLNSVFQFVAGFESRYFGSRDRDGVAGLRVAAYAAGTAASFERAKADQLYFVSACKSVSYFAKKAIQYGFYVFLCQAAFVCDVVDQVGFVHVTKFLLWSMPKFRSRMP
jgi:hypothetical protein